MNQQDNLEDEKQTESLADLPVAERQAEEIKAGTGSGLACGTYHVDNRALPINSARRRV